jgi:hypothetical protein
MTEVSITRVANCLNPFQERGAVEAIGYDASRDWLCERRPSGAGLKLLRGIEENSVTTQTGIDPGLKKAAHLRTEWTLSSSPSCDFVLFGAQLLAPFSVRLHHLASWGGISILGEVQNVGPFRGEIFGLHNSDASIQGASAPFLRTVIRPEEVHGTS